MTTHAITARGLVLALRGLRAKGGLQPLPRSTRGLSAAERQRSGCRVLDALRGRRGLLS